jgi:hypothetical protein
MWKKQLVWDVVKRSLVRAWEWAAHAHLLTNVVDGAAWLVTGDHIHEDWFHAVPAVVLAGGFVLRLFFHATRDG